MSKKWKNVSIPQCFLIMFVSILCLVVFAIPFSISPLEFSFRELLNKESNLIDKIVLVAEQGIPQVISATEQYKKIMEIAYKYLIYGYIGVIALNFACAFLLILTRSNILRKLFRLFSVIFGLCLIISALAFILYLVGIYGFYSINDFGIKKTISETGALFAVGMIVFSIILSVKQFHWFTAPF